SHERVHFASAHCEIHLLQRADAGEALRQLADFEQRGGFVAHALDWGKLNQYFRFGNSAAACGCSKTPSSSTVRFGNSFFAMIASTASNNCGPMSGLHSTVQFNLPAAIASKAPRTPSIETI